MMTTEELLAELARYPRRMPMTINGFPVTSVDRTAGRIRQDVLSTSFREMPDRPRDEAVVLRYGEGPALDVCDVQKAFSDNPGLPVFVEGEPVSGFASVCAYRSQDGFRYVYTDPDTVKTMVATPLRWTELSDGTQAKIHIWPRQGD